MDHDPDEPGDFGVLHLRFLHRLDQQLADLRQAYESYLPGERERIRQLLERAEAVNAELAEMGMWLKVGVEHDERDENGNIVRWADCEFSVVAASLAIRAWDCGEPFTPDSALT